MPILKLSRDLKTALIHVCGWAAYLLTVKLGASEMAEDFWTYLVSVKVPVIMLFYVSLYYIYPSYLAKKKYFKLSIAMLGLVLLATIMRFLITAFITQFHFIDDITSAELNNESWKQVRLNLAFVGISLALWFAGRNVEIEKEKREMENEVLNAELKALKYQINPHFLYNTLSFMYAKALPVSDDLSKAIAKLSEIMRYLLNGSTVDGLVSVEKEIEYIQNFIDLQQLRFSNNFFVDFHCNISSGDKRILPLILITFVENAFKHGILNEKEHPLKIDLLVNNERLEFKIVNKINLRVTEKSSGIGLSNVVKRLQLRYPDKHRLVISKENNYYAAQLTLII